MIREWLRSVFTSLRRDPDEAAKQRAEKVLARADRVIADYKKQDAAIRLIVVRRR